MPVLVTGGAGYIGSHMVWCLLDRGERVIVLDDLSTGLRDLVPAGALFIEGNAGDGALVSRLIAGHGVDAILHFPVRSSCRNPSRNRSPITPTTRWSAATSSRRQSHAA